MLASPKPAEGLPQDAKTLTSEEDKIFAPVLRAEHDAIVARRKKHGRCSSDAEDVGVVEPRSYPSIGEHFSPAPAAVTLPPSGGEESSASSGPDVTGPAPAAVGKQVYDTTGLALSGGGIRSAAFCLGALQALGARDLFPGIDYLSTVSGGGYIGSSLSAIMSEPEGVRSPPNSEFPFGAPNEIEDRDTVGHLRDYSNYLLPRGHKVLLDVICVLLRGWMTNLIFILGIVISCATLMIWAFPPGKNLGTSSFPIEILEDVFALVGIKLSSLFALMGKLAGGALSAFGFDTKKIVELLAPGAAWAMTLTFAVSLAASLLWWAIWRSRHQSRGSDVKGRMITWARCVLFALLAAAALEAQPFAVGLFHHLFFGPEYRKNLAQDLAWIHAALLSLSGVVVFFRDKLAGFLGKSESQKGTGVLLRRIAAQGALWVAALIVPFAVYVLFLWVCAAGISFGGEYDVAPWLVDGGKIAGFPVLTAYAAASGALLALIFQFAPNANSLHQLYRDKLSKAFLFKPAFAPRAGRDDLPDLDPKRLCAIAPPHGGPYHLINAAINLQNSRHANRRGRNASFFLFSAKYVGSDATGYAPTEKFVEKDRHLDLGTAMAISGAAVSSNMGSIGLGMLAPTLALFNARLGYWLINPKSVNEAKSDAPLLERARNKMKAVATGVAGWIARVFSGAPKASSPAAAPGWIRRTLARLTKYYLISEIFGRLDETSPRIYVTDGGHIENLGLYELLKRRCRAIIVIDAEADSAMTFRALAKVERYARIDLGTLVDLPWRQIGKASPPQRPDLSGSIFQPPGSRHCAIGVISYPNGAKGLLLYVKAAVTGDEADYVLDYKSRNPSFPHESTGDQFFSEEQFEAYRALGFHAVQGFFGDRLEFAWSRDVLRVLGIAPVADPRLIAGQIRDGFEDFFSSAKKDGQPAAR